MGRRGQCRRRGGDREMGDGWKGERSEGKE